MNLPVIDLDVIGGGNAQGSSYVGTFLDYSALALAFPTANFGDFANVENDQGTSWLPWTVGGTYYPEGTYYWNNTEWTSNVADIAEELQNIINNLATHGLPQTLSIDETTGANDISIDNDQIIKPTNGDSFINLRNVGVDGWLEMGGSTFSVIGGKLGVTDTAYFTLTGGGPSMSLFKSDFTKVAEMSIHNNDTAPGTSVPISNYPSSFSSESIIFLVGVINSVGLGGVGIIGKSNNRAYINGLAYNTGLDGELLVNHTPSSNDFTQTHQGKSGDIALLNDFWQAEIQSVLGLANQTTNYEPFFIQDAIPNVSAIGVWTITPPENGDYELYYYSTFSINSSASSFKYRILVNGVTYLEGIVESKDSAGAGILVPTVSGGVLGGNVNTGTSERKDGGNAILLTGIIGGLPLTIEPQFTAETASQEPALYYNRVGIRRVINNNV